MLPRLDIIPLLPMLRPHSPFWLVLSFTISVQFAKEFHLQRHGPYSRETYNGMDELRVRTNAEVSRVKRQS